MTNRLSQRTWLGSLVVVATIGLVILIVVILVRSEGSRSDQRHPDNAAVDPAIPGAVRAVPGWIDESFPFDAGEFFKQVPAAQNAAVPYLDALFEFDEGMADCFPESDREPRRSAARARRDRFDALEQARENQPDEVTLQQLCDVAAEYEEGFQKLRRAQDRATCVFDVGLDIDSPMPHAQAARHVARIVDYRIERDLSSGDFESSVNDLRMLFRLSRDLRPRGNLIVQLCSISMEARACDNAIGLLLRSSSIQESHCRELLTILTEHQSKAIDPLIEGLKAECLYGFQTIHDLENRTGPYDPKRPKKNREPDGGPIERVFDQVARAAGFYPKARESLRSFYSVALSLENVSTTDRMQSLPAVQGGIGANLVRMLVPDLKLFMDSLVRHEARLAGVECLIALRLWTLKHEGLPNDLAEVLAEAGRPQVTRWARTKPMTTDW